MSFYDRLGYEIDDVHFLGKRLIPMTEPFLRLIVFVVLMVATPGPANLLVIGGARLGLRAVSASFWDWSAGSFLNLAFGVGLGCCWWPADLPCLIKYAGAAYMA